MRINKAFQCLNKKVHCLEEVKCWTDTSWFSGHEQI